VLSSEALFNNQEELEGRVFSLHSGESNLCLKVDSDKSQGGVVLTPKAYISPHLRNALKERGVIQTISACGRRINLIVDYTRFGC